MKLPLSVLLFGGAMLGAASGDGICQDTPTGLNQARSCSMLLMADKKISMSHGDPTGGYGSVCVACGGEISQSGGQVIKGNAYFQCEADMLHKGYEHFVEGNVLFDEALVTAAIADAEGFCNGVKAYYDNAVTSGNNFADYIDYTLGKHNFVELSGTWVGQDHNGDGNVVVYLNEDAEFKTDLELCTVDLKPLYIIVKDGKKLKTNQGRVTLCPGLSPKNVVWNALGTSPDVASSGGGGGMGCCESVLTGTLCSLDRKVNLSPGYVDGAIYSRKDITLASGSIAKCEIATPPEVFGDPHFVDWGGDRYDYDGICDMVFLDSPANNLTVHIRTEQKFSYSYVSSAAVKINDDVLEFASWGSLIVNGVAFIDAEDEDVPTSLGGHKFTLKKSNKKTKAYVMDFGNGNGVEVKSHKDMVAVRLLGSLEDFADSRGLLGSPKDGSRLGREGTVIEDPKAFGQEWQVSEDEPKLFEVARHPQAPHPCVIPNGDAYMKVYRLGENLARKEAEKACKKWHMNKEFCIQDVLITGDLETAAAFYDD